eukprot:jgi/Undpi1/9767/HiC_scaffold_27.g12223.m1
MVVMACFVQYFTARCLEIGNSDWHKTSWVPGLSHHLAWSPFMNRQTAEPRRKESRHCLAQLKLRGGRWACEEAPANFCAGRR